jgi:hypothetical protein
MRLFRKVLGLALFSAFLPVLSRAQLIDADNILKTVFKDNTQGWKATGTFSFTVAQNALSNWAAGGQNSSALNLRFSITVHHGRGKESWDNTLDIAYGVMMQGENAAFHKTDDRLQFTSKYGYQAFSSFYFALLFDLRTQMWTGWDDPEKIGRRVISGLFAPAYLQTALGLDFKPSSHFSVLFAPVSAKITLVANSELSDAGAFGVAPGSVVKAEAGGFLKLVFSQSDFKTEGLRNVSLTLKLDLFSDYLDHPEDVDVNCETIIALKVNKFLSIRFDAHLLYDANVLFPNEDGTPPSPKIQFMEIFGAGLLVQF